MSDRAKELKDLFDQLIKKTSNYDEPLGESGGPLEAEYDSPSLRQYDQELHEAREVFIDRNKIYKDTFVALGLLGTVTTLIGDCHRLRNMIYLTPDHGRQYYDQIEDKLVDVLNQAAISLMMLHDENYEGK
jgi:hypothetical protein